MSCPVAFLLAYGRKHAYHGRMTDRVHSITLTLEHDIRIDDAEALLTACRAFRGVVNVTPNVSDYESHVAQERARTELGSKLLDVLYPNRLRKS